MRHYKPHSEAPERLHFLALGLVVFLAALPAFLPLVAFLAGAAFLATFLTAFLATALALPALGAAIRER